jgi:F0F1-type ATP synthase assembly protein I
MPAKSPGLRELAGLGSGIAILVGGGMALGWFIDSKAQTSPAFALVGVAWGMVMAGWYSYRQVKKYTQD